MKQIVLLAKNKLSIFLLLIVFFSLPAKAQVTFGSQEPPKTFSVLELDATIKSGGLRLPHLKSEDPSERDILESKFGNSSDAKGLVIFNTTTNCLEFWNGERWISLCNSVFGSLKVTPVSIVFDYQGACTSEGNIVTVTSGQPGWTVVTSSPSWVTIGSVTGTSFTVTVSSTTVLRIATITVSAGGTTRNVTVTQFPNNYNDSPVPAGMTIYAGAFWKHNQTGERLIRIARPSTGTAADGAWTATVVVDGGMGIKLDKALTTDSNIGWGATPNENLTSDGLSSAVSAGASVSGTLQATATPDNVTDDKYIYFRIGLTNTLANAATAPRYGLVMLTYNNNTMSQRIFIRQGQGADYLPGQSSGKQWSPYNVGKYDSPNQYGAGTNGFVAYPTQAGYFYQWRTDAGSYPRHPVDPPSGVYTGGWTAGTQTSIQNVCPTGYIVPTGILDFTYFPAQPSTAWGYYADGFFDRRQIVTSPTGAVSSAVSYNSSILTDNVAYIGKLFYNSTTNASIFMPAVGASNFSDGNLYGTGNNGFYWSSTENDSSTALHMNFNNTTSTNSSLYPSKAPGFNLRCILE